MQWIITRLCPIAFPGLCVSTCRPESSRLVYLNFNVLQRCSFLFSSIKKKKKKHKIKMWLTSDTVNVKLGFAGWQAVRKVMLREA